MNNKAALSRRTLDTARIGVTTLGIAVMLGAGFLLMKFIVSIEMLGSLLPRDL